MLLVGMESQDTVKAYCPSLVTDTMGDSRKIDAEPTLTLVHTCIYVVDIRDSNPF
jgi:hypothetical protein